MQAETHSTPISSDSALRRVVSFLFWTVVFGLSYTQAPLNYSNQNQYLVHGMAEGRLGFLSEDWLARTGDPTPVFSRIVALTHRFLNDHFLFVDYLLILGIYFHSLVGLFAFILGIQPTERMRFWLATLLVVTHSGLIRWAAVRLFGIDYPWYLQSGIANQYLLGPVLQPSVFGVALLFSIYVFLLDRPFWAVVCLAVGCTLHSTYLLSAAFLTLAYMVVLLREGRRRDAVLAGGLSFALVLPVVGYNLWMFKPSSAEVFAKSQQILVEVRIPHHAMIQYWFDATAIAQLIVLVGAMFLVRGQRLFLLMVVPSLLSLGLSLVQFWTGNDTLALLFPWRISAVLVPLATMVILAKLVQLFARFQDAPVARAMSATCFVLLIGAVVGGVAIQYFGLAYASNQEELPLMEYVRSHKRSGEVYMLPVTMPKSSPPKSLIRIRSTSFTPPPRPSKDSHLIAVDFQRFRLMTGAPIFIDYKSIPYRDTEVMEWHQRMLLNQSLYEAKDWQQTDIQDELRRGGITHVVTTIQRELPQDCFEKIYEDGSYRIFRLRSGAVTRE